MPQGPQLDSDALFGDAEGGIWVHSHDAGNSYTYRMPSTHEVLQVECGDVVAGWSSSNGATYLVTTAKHPLLRFFEGNFARLPLETPTASAVLVGRSGATPEQDRLLLLTRASHVRHEGRATELWCGTPGNLERTALDIVGSPVGVAFGEGDELWVGIRAYAEGEPSLLRVSSQGIERVALPKAAGAKPNVNGLACTPAGHLLVMIGDRSKEKAPAEAWLHRIDGDWQQVLAPSPLLGWLSDFGLLNHASKVYVPTMKGVFSYDGESLVNESQQATASLWRCGDTLVARGYKGGQHAHEILRDGRWLPLSVPEPEVVGGAQGKQVYLAGKNALPVRRVRLAAVAPVVPAEVSTAQAKATQPRKFEFGGFIENLAKHPDAKKRKKALDLAARVKADRGLPISEELRAYLTVLGTHTLDFCVGHWFNPDPDDLKASGIDRIAAFQDSAHTPALLSSLLPIGVDGSGNHYCVELAKARSRVFVLDHDLDEFTLVSDSLCSFAELNELEHEWQELADAEGFDHDDYDRKHPGLQSLQVRAKALAGRVNAVLDYADTLHLLAGKKLVLRGKITQLPAPSRSQA